MRRPTHSWFIVLSLVCLVLIYFLSTIYMTLASLAYGLILWGIFLRKQTRIHWKLMSAAMLIDLSLVLSLEIGRDAVATALAFKLNAFQQTHILFSSLAVLLYFPLAILGGLLLQKRIRRERWRPWHIRLGWWAFAFRSLGFALMFSLLSR